MAEELRWKSALLNAPADLLYRTAEVFRRAVAAVIDFSFSQYKSIFSPTEAANIKQVMRSYAGKDIERQKTVCWRLIGYAESRNRLDPVELKQTYREVDDIAAVTTRVLIQSCINI